LDFLDNDDFEDVLLFDFDVSEELFLSSIFRTYVFLIFTSGATDFLLVLVFEPIDDFLITGSGVSSFLTRIYCEDVDLVFLFFRSIFPLF